MYTTWKELYSDILASDKMKGTKLKMKTEREKYNILPGKTEVFNAFKLCPYKKLKVVIIGQDPYPSAENAHGLAFSSKAPGSAPKSLQNIFKEIIDDVEPITPYEECFPTNDLTYWAQQGVLLLNTVLTVRENETNSHRELGWQYFTQGVVDRIAKRYDRPVVFILWGKEAEKMESMITHEPSHKHLVLKAAHPSPLSAEKGFFGCRHFSQANDFLKRAFFQTYEDLITEKYDFEELLKIAAEWCDIHGIRISDDNLMKYLKFINGQLLSFVAVDNPNISTLWAIDWKTKKIQS